jgi:hypothetical protein
LKSKEAVGAVHQPSTLVSILAPRGMPGHQIWRPGVPADWIRTICWVGNRPGVPRAAPQRPLPAQP